MSSDAQSRNKALLFPWRAALYDFDLDKLTELSERLVTKEAVLQFGFPFETLNDRSVLLSELYEPLSQAFPDIERRDTVVIAGATEKGEHWVGCCGFYTGSFMSSWLDIPPTGHQCSLRFHEFYKIVDEKIVEIQALWDIPSLMMQANAWPMGPSLGREWLVPGPATQDGLVQGPYNEKQSAASCKHVIDMLTALVRHPNEGGPEIMELGEFWHPKMSWYGPSGIGTCRGFEGFRHWHQIPFLNAMPDRGQSDDELDFHFFADSDYVAVTGWPNMVQTISAGGWLGITPTQQKIGLRSLDFWRLEKGLIRENWVMVDLLSAWHQVGVDVLGRMREFNKAKNTGPIMLPDSGL